MIMTQEDKQLLLKDLCATLPYGVIGAVPHYDENGEEVLLQGKITGFNKGQIKFEYLPDCTDDVGAYNWFDIDLVKPYLRPMSSMTEEEYNEMNELVGWSAEMQLRTNGLLLWLNVYESVPTILMVKIFEVIDWLNAHHFDYRGLIEQGLAIEVTEDNNPYKN